MDYDSEALTKDCISSKGCALNKEIENNVIPNIGNAGKLGDRCYPNTEATESSMAAELSESK